MPPLKFLELLVIHMCAETIHTYVLGLVSWEFIEYHFLGYFEDSIKIECHTYGLLIYITYLQEHISKIISLTHENITFAICRIPKAF